MIPLIHPAKNVDFFGWMSQGGHYEPLLLLALFYWWTSSWTCRTTPRPWSRCPPGQFFWLDESRGSFWATFTFSTFLPEHSFMLKSYRWVGWGGVGGPWDFIVTQVPLVLTLGLWDLGLGLDNLVLFWWNRFLPHTLGPSVQIYDFFRGSANDMYLVVTPKHFVSRACN